MRVSLSSGEETGIFYSEVFMISTVHLVSHVVYVLLYLALVVLAIISCSSGGFDLFAYAGMVVLALGVIVLSAAERERKKGGTNESSSGKHQLVTNGVYSFVRHPEFLAHSLIIISLVLISRNVYSMVLGAILILFLGLAIKDEEKRNMEKFGNEYIDYMKKVPALNPLAKLMRKLSGKKNLFLVISLLCIIVSISGSACLAGPLDVKVVSSRELDVSSFNKVIEGAIKQGLEWPHDAVRTAVNVLCNGGQAKEVAVLFEANRVENPDTAVVIIARDGFADDSIRGDWYKVTLYRKNDCTWRFENVQRAFRCYRKKSTDCYSAEPCL